MQNSTDLIREIIARNTARQILAGEKVEAPNLDGATDYFSNRASFKDTKEPAVQGAHLLKNKDEIKILKGCAPLAPRASEVKGDVSFAGSNTLAASPAPHDNDLAASATTPDKALVGSLHSSNEEKKSNVDGDCAPDDDGDAVLIEEDDAAAAPVLMNPNFYKVRIDFFDNGDQPNKTRFRAKFSCDVNPTDDAADKYVIYANYYNRPREYRRAITNAGMSGEFYDFVEDIFEEKRKDKRDYKIKPLIAILREEFIDGMGRKRYNSLAYTASILYQVQGEEPKVLMIYQLFQEVITLDTKFTAQRKSSLYKIGIYKDASRAHLEPSKDAPSKMVVRGSDFFKNRSGGAA